MEKIRVVSGKDIALAFCNPSSFITRFRTAWDEELGDLIQYPGRNQLAEWARISGFDEELLLEAMRDLRSRTLSTPGLNPEAPYAHAIRHYSSAIIRLTRARYGRCRPHKTEAA